MLCLFFLRPHNRATSSAFSSLNSPSLFVQDMMFLCWLLMSSSSKNCHSVIFDSMPENRRKRDVSKFEQKFRSFTLEFLAMLLWAQSLFNVFVAIQYKHTTWKTLHPIQTTLTQILDSDLIRSFLNRNSGLHIFPNPYHLPNCNFLVSHFSILVCPPPKNPKTGNLLDQFHPESIDSSSLEVNRKSIGIKIHIPGLRFVHTATTTESNSFPSVSIIMEWVLYPIVMAMATEWKLCHCMWIPSLDPM